MLILAVAAITLGCQAGPPPGARALKIEIVGKGGNTVEGNLAASSPPTAGLSNKAFAIKVPGSIELQAGPSEYTLVVSGGMPDEDLIKVFVDGRELKRGNEVVYEANNGPRLTFTIDSKTATP